MRKVLAASNMDLNIRFPDIKTKLDAASKLLEDIQNLYKNSLSEKCVSSELKDNIDTFLGKLRSALDYLWKKVPDSKGNFPICNSQKKFQNTTTGVKTEILDVISPLQEYNGNYWLQNFAALSNSNKHFGLTPQTKIETPVATYENRGVSVRLTGSASIKLSGNARMLLGGKV